MRVAIPTWQGRISPVFDSARELLVVDVENAAVNDGRVEPLPDEAPQARVARLRQLGANVLVCGAVSRYLADMIVATGIEVIPFVAGDVEEILGAFLSGALPAPAFSMPGCRRMRRRGRGGRGARWGVMR